MSDAGGASDPGPQLGPGVEVLVRDPNGVIALAKPAGILSHPNSSRDQHRSLIRCRYDPGAQCYTWTDADGVRHQWWLLNRLDGATSGVILLASVLDLARDIRRLFAGKRVRKVYQALVFGQPAEKSAVWRDLLAVQKEAGQIRTHAAGNVPSEARFTLLAHRQGSFSLSLVQLEPRTGRSHQLRVQCAKRRLPIVGDQTYGDFALNRAFAKATGEKRLFLHSLETTFDYESGGRRVPFKAIAPLPVEFGKVMG